MIKRPDSNDIFSGQPHEIFAIRLAARWTAADLASVLECTENQVTRWEMGRARPLEIYRRRMVMQVNCWRDEYLAALKRIVPGNRRKLSFRIVKKTLQKGFKSRILILTPEELEAINAKKRFVRRAKANFKNLEPVDFSVRAPEPAYRSSEPLFRADQPVFVP